MKSYPWLADSISAMKEGWEYLSDEESKAFTYPNFYESWIFILTKSYWCTPNTAESGPLVLGFQQNPQYSYMALL